MARSQIYKTRKGTCARCGEESRQVERVSKRIMPPDGGLVCLDCLVPAALEAQEKEPRKLICERCKQEIQDGNKCGCYPFFPLTRQEEDEDE